MAVDIARMLVTPVDLLRVITVNIASVHINITHCYPVSINFCISYAQLALCLCIYIFIQKTDICEHALEALSRSNIKRVWMVGRGGPLQVQLTTKELREMARVPHCQAQLNSLDLARVKGLIEGKLSIG